MAKRNVSFSKKGLDKTQLKRVGIGVERHWEYRGKSYKTMRELIMSVRKENEKKEEVCSNSIVTGVLVCRVWNYSSESSP